MGNFIGNISKKKEENVKEFKKHISIIFLYGILSLYATFPLIFRMRNFLYGYPKDSLVWVWNFWWFRYSSLNGVSPDSISIIGYPFITTTTTLYPIWNWFNKHLALIVGEVAAYNLQIISGFFLAAVAMYCLVYYFTKNKLASFFSGVIFSLCPYHFARSWAHLGLTQIHWMVFYILSLFVLIERRTYKSALMCGF